MRAGSIAHHIDTAASSFATEAGKTLGSKVTLGAAVTLVSGAHHEVLDLLRQLAHFLGS
jgi:hypothetical protein